MNGKSRAWALALLVAVFLVGGAAGAAVDRILVGDRAVESSQRDRSGDRGRRRSYVDWLAGELELSEEQKAEVQAILERHRGQVEDLWRQMRPRYEELQEQARAEIRGLLTEEQTAAYDALLERQRRREHRDDDRRREDNREDSRDNS
ncbi:MAG: hypothetical protein PVG79_03230 [Gemmatimonadales bacterium]|jgi:hypothetical protein